MKKISISEGEWNIMNVLWTRSPRTIMQITAELKDVTGWSKNTVITMLGRLEAKGVVHYKEGKRAKQYYPSVARARVAMEATESFLNKVYQGSLGMMVNTMVSQQGLKTEEIEELYEILRRAEEDMRKETASQAGGK